MELLLAVVVHTANMQDWKGARWALAKGFDRLESTLADGTMKVNRCSIGWALDLPGLGYGQMTRRVERIRGTGAEMAG
jgi:muramidase (phage lysozyme)